MDTTSNAVPVPVEEEKTVPEVRSPTMAELMDRMRRRAPNPLWDCDNGVDDRGGW